jgi:hypothetical protein
VDAYLIEGKVFTHAQVRVLLGHVCHRCSPSQCGTRSHESGMHAIVCTPPGGLRRAIPPYADTSPSNGAHTLMPRPCSTRTGTILHFV